MQDTKSGAYLYHNSELGEFCLGSDAITHSYRNQKRKQWLVEQIPEEVNKLFDAGSTIGALIIFPNNRIDGKQTINQYRGINRLIDDRFDLTLECIRRFYLGLENPLNEVLTRYKDFFDLFESFIGYTQFFLLDDLLDSVGNIRFFLPFTHFEAPPLFGSVDDYLEYKANVIQFIRSRNERIRTLNP